MVLLGLSILVVSFTYLLFRYPLLKWSKAIALWRRGKDVFIDRASARRKNVDDEVLVSLRQIRNTERRNSTLIFPNGNFHTGKSDAPKLLPPSASESDSGNTSVTSAVPTFTLDSGQSDGGIEMVSPNQQQAENPVHKLRGSRLAATPETVKPRSQEAGPTPLSSIHNSETALGNRQPANLLMPPPPRANALRPLPKLGNSLNPPPSLASTLRAPPLPASKASTSAASYSTLAPSARPSKKVVLPPGHSPLDWAHLTAHPPTPTFLRGDDVPMNLIKVTPSQLRQQNGRKGKNAWGTWQGKVYNLTPYLKFHPGGQGELMRGAGKNGDAERLFLDIHPWVNWDAMLGECLIGILVGEPDSAGSTEQGLDLEAMD